jgi:hypothetical protein
VKEIVAAHMIFGVAVLTLLLLSGTVQAATWFLMAADIKAISQPKAANMMVKGSVAGPIRFTAQGNFESRPECESRRQEMVQSWRHHSITARGGWARLGFTSPNVFAQCVSADDPRLSKASGANPTMDVLLQTRRVRTPR